MDADLRIALIALSGVVVCGALWLAALRVEKSGDSRLLRWERAVYRRVGLSGVADVLQSPRGLRLNALASLFAAAGFAGFAAIYAYRAAAG